MNLILPSTEDRLCQIIDLSYQIFQARIINGTIEQFDNEASMQLQLGVILQNVGLLYEWAEDEHFSIRLEKKFKLENATSKSSNGNARCDIYLELCKGEQTYKVGIELKYLPKSKDEATTDCRLSILCDVENLEYYKLHGYIDKGYAIVYTTNSNYADPNTRSNINIGDRIRVAGGKSNYKEVTLNNTYTFHWDSHQSHHFLKVEV